ncbi:MAG TPA: helix-turn-helix domain-containing protein [Chloroflexota bacterium]|nr:helix-turn-helix domain-containing protein [Chloroflexota bacterium]
MRFEEVRSGGPPRASSGTARGELLSRLRERRPEIEAATLTRIMAVPDASPVANYTEAFRTAISSALDFALAELGSTGSDPAPVPVELLLQTRVAARNSVELDTVLRRYLASYNLFSDFLIEEAGRAPEIRGAVLVSMLRSQAALFDRMLAAIAEEYRREAARPSSSDQRRAALVGRLLVGELPDPSILSAEFAYELDQFHLGATAFGAEAADALQQAGRALNLRTMLVRRGEDSVWAWFGSRQALDSEELCERIAPHLSDRLALALGEPGAGLDFWRLSHRQALSALPIALRDPGVPVRYSNVALQASMLRDEVLVASLRELYLVPLRRMRDGGELARETLRAYFEADRNISSTAAALGVSRPTVSSRLRAVEKALGCHLSSASEELNMALRVDDLLPTNTLRRK